MKVRVDFGRIFPGLILFLLGLVLLVLLAIVAVLAFFFSFIPWAGGVLAVALELTIVPALLIAAGIVTILTGVSWWGKGGTGRLLGVARARATEDNMRPSARVGEVIGIIIAFIVFLFLYENQLRGVAFFAPSFGSQAEVFFYGPLFTGMVLSLARAIYGRRNAIRPFDALNQLFLAFSAFWLLNAFPFDFTHFGDMFPTAIQFVFWWLSNGIGRILLALAGIGASISFVYTTVLYVSVRRWLHDLRSGPSTVPEPGLSTAR